MRSEDVVIGNGNVHIGSVFVNDVLLPVLT
jgi:hypothetical protein